MPTVPPNPPSVPPGPTATEGVAAMIPVANITLEDAMLDNPNFRASIKLFEGQVFFIENWLTALQRSMNQFTEEWKRLNEVTSVLNKRAEVPLLSQGMLSSQYTIPAMKLVGGAFRTTLALKNKYISEVNEQVLKPLEEFLKTDLRDFKESKRVFDKALEKYESTLAKYNGQSRQKEPTDHFGSMALQVLQLKTYMKDHKQTSAVSVQELEQNKERYTADAIEYWKPSRSLKCYSNTVPASKSTIGHAALGPAFAAHMVGQVPLNTLMARPATISQFPTASNSRLPIPPHFQSQPALASLSSTSAGNGTSIGSQESLLAPTDTLSVNSAHHRSSNASLSSLPNAAALPATTDVEFEVGPCTPTTKQGYLNIRIPQPKNRAPVWQRKYFFIQEGEFGFESVVSNPTVGSQVVQSERISVLLCEVRHGPSSNSLVTVGGGGNSGSGSQGLAMVQMERRFCFEVVCATQSYLLQAETEDDLMSWANTFEAAKRDMLLQQHLPRHSESDEPYSPMVPDSAHPTFSFTDEGLLDSQNAEKATEESKFSAALGLGWAANVPGVSLLLGSYAGSNPPSSKNSPVPDQHATLQETGDSATDQPDTNLTSETDIGTEDSKPESKPAVSVDTSSPVIQQQPVKEGAPPPLPLLNTNLAPQPRSKSVGDVGTNPEQVSGHSQQVSEMERLMTSTLHLVPRAAPMAVSEIPHYPMELAVRNRELHLRFHGTKVHSKEYVLHSWTSGYLDESRPDKPIMIYGRIFLTQSGMYFYARDMSVETKRMYRFSSIRGIECEQKDISTEWRIETMDGVKHIFCQFTLTDTEYQVLHLIWTNVHQAKDRMPVKELFRRTMLITNKPRGSAGSGSLAETESSHQTTREGAGSNFSGHEGDVVDSPCGAGSEAASIMSNSEDWKDLDEELDQNFKIPAKTLDRLLFGNDSPVWKEFHDRRNNKIQSVGEWTQSEGQKTRTVKYLMVVNNPMVKLNQADCVETQVCEVEEEHLRYSYIVKSNVLAMPYSDAFTPVVRYCITYVNKNESKLTCSSGIDWHKSPLVKAMIKGAVLKGTAETIKDLTEILQAHSEHRKTRSATGSAGEGASGRHDRTDSSNITISLNGPDERDHSILLDPLANVHHLDRSPNGSQDGRAPGLRRHTVSAGTDPGKVAYPGAKVQGNWPTGAPPSFVPIGSKASRTRLLGRPSRSTLLEQEATLDTQGSKPQELPFGVPWIKATVLGLVQAKDDKDRQRLSKRLLYLVLVMTSLINIWAAFNSQRMLNAAWRIQEQGALGWNGPLRGYLEPENRGLLDHDHHPSGSTTGRNVRVAARAVYLKDLEERMLSEGLEGFDDRPTIDRSSFEVFLDVRESFRPWPATRSPLEWFGGDQNGSQKTFPASSASPSTSTSLAQVSPSPTPSHSDPSFEEMEEGLPRYPWLLPRHRRWATKIVFQRDRVGILRHDLLVTFEVLKQLERRLLETEYVNWIMDERMRCRLWERRKNSLLEKQQRGATHLATAGEEGAAQSETDSQGEGDEAQGERIEDAQPEDGTPKERLLEADTTKEFCRGVDRQLELLQLV
ncbi:SNF1-interacting protein [Mortierella alpina]|uniref:SNF1-interacting protein n=1 Tax=Mortierella alpina TaxID=64518 RepID=A0A9P6J2E6_MORAP|nr:SNF1-interacting protein [Mortierella alpina]